LSAPLDVYSRIYRCIACIPEGKVATYGQIASLVDASGPRQVGYALSSTPLDIKLPWHRVVNAKGEISKRSDGDVDSEQHRRLLDEGILLNKNGRINLKQYRWQAIGNEWLDEEDIDDFWLNQPGVG